MSGISKQRLKKELEVFSSAPPSGISCVCSNDQFDVLSAQILGPSETPFEGGIFQLEIQVPDRYPFEPPRIRFVTPIYHPNIDTSGRICLDTLKLPPQGTWNPCLNLSTVLMMIRVLMAEPGTEDPLMTDIWQEFRYDYTTYTEKAKKWTRQHAMGNQVYKENSNSDDRSSTHKMNEMSVNVEHHRSSDHLSQSRKTTTENSATVSVTRQDKRPALRMSESIITDNKKPKLL